MDLRPSPEQQQLVSTFADIYRTSSGTEAVASAEGSGHLPQLWHLLQQTGALEMAVPESLGGHGASLLDLELVAEQHGRAIAPAPLIEAQVAARALARIPGERAAAALASALHGELVTVAVRPCAPSPTGERAELVPAGAIASRALVRSGQQLLLVDLAASATPVANLGSLPLADVTVPADAPVLLEGSEAVAVFATAVDEWRVLTAAALSGLARRALEIGVAYVKERKAFGQYIGAFQAIAHPLADRAAEVDGCELLVREAAWAADEDPARAPELAAMALGFAAETARDTTSVALHAHGGYGFMLEYPIQLYFRRARAWGGVLENPATSYRAVADRHELVGTSR